MLSDPYYLIVCKNFYDFKDDGTYVKKKFFQELYECYMKIHNTVETFNCMFNEEKLLNLLIDGKAYDLEVFDQGRGNIVMNFQSYYQRKTK